MVPDTFLHLTPFSTAGVWRAWGEETGTFYIS